MKRTLGRVVLVLLGLLGGLVLAELALSALLDAYVCDEQLGWAFEPDSTSLKLSRLREYPPVAVEINAHGFRDVERRWERPPDTYRIVLLGDSIGAALQVPREENFASRLEASLRAELAPGRQLEVLNASVDGYGTAQELLLFRDRVARYDADLVLLQMFLGNDLTDNYAGSNPSHYLEQRCGRPYFTLEDGALEPLATPSDSKPKSPNLLDRMLRVSKLYGNLVSLPPKRPPRLRKLDIFRTAPHQPLEESWDLTQRLVLTLRDEVEARGSTLMVLVIPTKYEVHQKANPEMVAGVHDLARPIQRLERFLEGADIPFINMAPFLETAIVDRGTQPYFEIDSHLRSEGHALLAHEIRVFLLEHCKTLGLPAAGCAS